MSTTISSITEGQRSQASSGDPSKGILYTKDYNIVALNLLAGQFITIDLKPAMVELSYYEDIYSNSISGQILMSDAQGFIEKMGIHGNEYLRMVFGKDDNPDIRIDRLFRIYKMSPRQKAPGMDVENYVLYFCSDELILSQQYRVSKSYVDKQISDIVKDILKNYIKVPDHKYRDNQIEATKGISSIIVPNFKPFEAINWLARSALPAQNVGADMLFFENAVGYNFISLQSLFQRIPYVTYMYRPKNVDTSKYGDRGDEQLYNVLGYEIINSFNTIEGLESGMFANRLLTIDPLLRRYQVTDFNYMEYQKTAKSMNQNPIVSNLQNRFGDALYETPEGCYKLTITNKDNGKIDYIKKRPESVTKDAFSEIVFSQRKSQLALSNYTRMKFYVSGDPNLTVGTTVNFRMLTQDPASEKDPKSIDKYYSGKYLITAVRHIIQTAGYNTIIEAVKESLPNNYATVDNNKPIFKNTVAGVKK